MKIAVIQNAVKIMKKFKRGLIQIYTGEGKGKTTAALGQTVRALGWGMSVCWIQFIKGNSNIGEVKFLKNLPKKVAKKLCFKQFHRTKTYAIGKPQNVHKVASQKALEFMEKMFKKDQYEMLILDELNNALEYNLIELEKVIRLIQNKPKKLHLVVTGRDAHPKIIKLADLVTEMKKKKHPFDKGFIATKGIEY